jgi:hypothetical protein
MNKLEKNLYAKVKRNLGMVKFDRIENAIGSGFPDAVGQSFETGRRELIEFKMAKGNRIYFQLSQIAWMMADDQYSGTSWVVWEDGKTDLTYVTQSQVFLAQDLMNLLPEKYWWYNIDNIMARSAQFVLGRQSALAFHDYIFRD